MTTPANAMGPSQQVALQPTPPDPANQDSQELQATAGPFVSPSPLEASTLEDRHCAVPTSLATAAGAALSASQAAAVPQVLQLTGSPSATTCRSLYVKWFPSVAAAEAAQPGLVVPPSYGATRQLWMVTIHGSLTFTPLAQLAHPVQTDHWNALFDATTGAYIGGGTAGTPLS